MAYNKHITHEIRSFFNMPKFLLNAGLSLALVCLSSISHSEINDDFHVGDAEPIIMIASDVDSSASEGNTSETKFSFYAYGKQFDLLLSENKKLMSQSSINMKQAKFYKGEIDGVYGSWARINIIDGEYSGAIFDGHELYLLDAGSKIFAAADDVVQSSMDSTDTAIFKASDITSTSSCGGDHEGHSEHEGHFSYKSFVEKLKKNRQNDLTSAAQLDNGFSIPSDEILRAEGATSQLNISIVADTQYVATSPNGAEAQVLSQMNIVDGIFSEQVGVQITVDSIRALSNNGSLTSSSAGTLLNQFGNFIGNANPGLAHLFTGRNIDGNTIGIAFLRAICTRNGVGVTQAGGRGVLGALTVAHELGHNFGAPHDNQGGSACANSPSGFLMNPSLNGSDQFSQCSLDQISTTLGRASCLVDIDDPISTPTPTPGPLANCNFSNDFSSGSASFSFIDDAQTPVYTSGSASNGALNISVGGVDDNDISNMEGAWRTQCNSSSSAQANWTVTADLSQTSEYEANEISQVAIRINGVTTVLAQLNGNGNGGANENVAEQQYTGNVSLAPGVNTIELVCSNNLKTFNNETTTCGFSSVSVVSDSNALIDTTSNDSFDSFTFDSNNPTYASGNLSASEGVNDSAALITTLGGVDNADITDMSGNWTQTFNNTEANLSLSLDARLTQTSEYESDETSQIGVFIDGQLQVLNSVTGDGNGGTAIGTGFQTYRWSINNLAPGSHSISLYCFNNKKTFANEITSCVFDNIILE